MPDQHEPVPPALLALLEGKNSEIKKHHLAVRIGDLQGSRVQAVREVLNEWAPKYSSELEAFWNQVRQATELYADQIDALNDEIAGTIPGIQDPEHGR